MNAYGDFCMRSRVVRGLIIYTLLIQSTSTQKTHICKELKGVQFPLSLRKTYQSVLLFYTNIFLQHSGVTPYKDTLYLLMEHF